MASGPIYIPDGKSIFPIGKFAIPQHYSGYLDDILIPHGLISDRIEKMAREVHSDYQGKKLHTLCVLKGGDRVFSALSKFIEGFNSSSQGLSIPMTYDSIRAQSYQNERSTGIVNLMGSLEDMNGRHVLVIEDIVDTGKTIKRLTDEILKFGPASVKVLSLLLKRTPKWNGFTPDYCGFSMPDEFVVGYCLDYNEHFRDLHHICILNEKGKEEFKQSSS